jgi:hypothetical protein
MGSFTEIGVFTKTWWICKWLLEIIDI